MKSGQVGVGSNIAQNHSFSLWEVIFAPIHMKGLSEVKLGKVIICPNLALSTLILPQYIIFGPYLPVIIYIFPYLVSLAYITPI